MATKIEDKIWDLFSLRNKKLLVWGLKNNKIFSYSDKLISKLRTITYGGVPASIILLSDALSNGYCYDRALLMSQAFLEDDDIDVKLIYASIDSLKRNPNYKSDSPLAYDHCFVEIKDKEHDYIIDTSYGFIIDKNYYWLMEHPKVRKINDKESIKEFLKNDEEIHSENIDNDKYAMPCILPFIEMTYGRPNEMYTIVSGNMLKREIEVFKDSIKYDEVVEEIHNDMKRLGFM